MMKQKDNRAFNAGVGENSSPNMVRRAGGDLGNDPRRVVVQNIIDRKIADNSISGYNHANTPEADSFAREAERKAMGKGTPNPDGTYNS